MTSIMNIPSPVYIWNLITVQLSGFSLTRKYASETRCFAEKEKKGRKTPNHEMWKESENIEMPKWLYQVPEILERHGLSLSLSL